MLKTYQPLDELIEKSGYRTEAVAEKMGISYSVLYKLRKRPDKISALRAYKLSEVINVPTMAIIEIINQFTQELDKKESERQIAS